MIEWSVAERPFPGQLESGDLAVVEVHPPAANGENVTPRRSPELEDVLRLAASRAAHSGRAASVDDVVQEEVQGRRRVSLAGQRLVDRGAERAATSGTDETLYGITGR